MENIKFFFQRIVEHRYDPWFLLFVFIGGLGGAIFGYDEGLGQVVQLVSLGKFLGAICYLTIRSFRERALLNKKCYRLLKLLVEYNPKMNTNLLREQLELDWELFRLRSISIIEFGKALKKYTQEIQAIHAAYLQKTANI